MAAGIYVRISKDRTGAGLGVARQEKECRELADTLGLSVTRVYVDNDLSAKAKSRRRPDYEQLKADARSGLIDAIVVWHTDRLTRSNAELEDFIDAAPFPVHAVQAGPLDLRTPGGRMQARIVGAVAQHEIELKTERQRAKNRQLAEGGERVGRGGPVPFGYADDRVTPHPVHGEMVRKAYVDVLAGRGLAGIAMDWQTAGAPVPQARSGRWDRGSVKRVLSRESNAGLVVLRGKVLPGVEGAWEPLVTVSDYYAVRAILADPARRTSPGSAVKYLLSGIAVCGSCGQPMRRQKTATGSAYACANRPALRGTCPQPTSILLDRLDEYVTERLLAERGGEPGVTVGVVVDVEEAQAQGATLEELDARLRSIALQMADPDADVVSLSAALVEAKVERARVASEPIERKTTSTLTVAQSWSPEVPEEWLLSYRRDMLKAQLAPGGLRVLPVGRSRRLAPIEERVTVAWSR